MTELVFTAEARRTQRKSLEGLSMQRGQFDELSSQIISAAIEVHRALGPGLLESAYEQCLCRELELRGVPFVQQQPVPVEYKGVRLECGYRLDICVAGRIVVEEKSLSELLPIHEAQLLTYLKLTDLSL